MNRYQLIYLLHELIDTQDNVTHVNEKGPEFAEDTKISIIERERILQAVLSCVDSLVAQAAQPTPPAPCAHRYHAEDEKDLICIDCGAKMPRR